MRKGLPRAARVRRGTEIRHLLRRGRRWKAGSLDVFVGPAPGTLPRFGLIVPKHGRTIVERNRLRRRLREIGRIRVLPALTAADRALDVLVRTRPQAYSASFAELEAELTHLTERLCSDASPSG